MAFYVYVLECADKSYYTGHTDNLEMRLACHQAGEIVGYTSSRLPIKLVFSQSVSTREETLIAERQIKGWSRAKKEAMMKGDWNMVSILAKSNNLSNAVHPSTGSGRTEFGVNDEQP